MSIRPRERATDPPRLVGRVDQSENGSATYTVAPDDAAGYDLMSRWISASTDVVESLEAMR